MTAGQERRSEEARAAEARQDRLVHRQLFAEDYGWEQDRLALLQGLATRQRVLLLQGPNGPFFYRLAKFLQGRDAQVWKINFNTADQFFYAAWNSVKYDRSADEWPRFFLDFLKRNGIEQVVLFGQNRPFHQPAIAICREQEIPVYVFEEGYVRPDWVTLERDGVNAESSLMFYQAEVDHPVSTLPRPRKIRFGYLKMAFYSSLYFLIGTLWGGYHKSYRHHKPFGVANLIKACRLLAMKPIHVLLDYRLALKLQRPRIGEWFLVPLQVSNDSQIQYASTWSGNEEFIRDVIESFVAHATPGAKLVFKHHPLERGHVSYRPFIRAVARQLGVLDRVFYLHEGVLPKWFATVQGVVVINSTVGLQAIHHGVAVVATGLAIYDKPGLTFQGGLDQFWQARFAPDREAVLRFLIHTIATTQINASFYTADALGWGLDWLWAHFSSKKPGYQAVDSEDSLTSEVAAP